MNHRSLVSVGVLIVLIAVGWLAIIPVAGQGPSAAASANEAAAQQSYIALRTPDDQPDLQGFWTNQTYTPLERPDDVTEAFYTPEEVAAIEQGRAQRGTAQTVPGTDASLVFG